MKTLILKRMFSKQYLAAKLQWALKKRNAIRWVPAFFAGIILIHAALPTISSLVDRNLYQLSADALRVVGSANSNLSAKFTFDKASDSWLFNKDGKSLRASQIAAQQGNGSSAESVASALTQMQAQVGGGGKKDESLYSVELPSDAKKGITFYDNQTSQSFKMVPQFTTGVGKKWQGRIIYPFGDGGQVVYTAKTNGIKEDIVLNKFVSNELSYSYKLELPDTLEAKLLDDGSVGVFSADPALFSNITYGAGADREKVESARKSAPKDHLAFAVPAPIVKDAKNKELKAVYTLRSGVLTVTANRLDKLTYPVSIDPSVAITSSSDFQKGNDEGMIDFSTSGQIDRARVSGGDTGAWATTSVLNSYSPVRFNVGYAAYNGYLYLVGGTGTASQSSAVHYAQINSDGTVNAWQATTSMPHSRMYPNVVAYNGYLYAYAGSDNGNHGGQIYNTVIYAAINSDGTIGSWQTSSNTMSTTVCRSAYSVYNGYLYALGGQTAPGGACPNSGSTVTNVVQYAPIYANGDVGAWTTTTVLPTARQSTAAAAYNGYMYIHGGAGDFTSPNPNDMYYARINSNGTLGAWTAGTSPFSTYRHNLVAYKGYLYVMNGDGAGSSLQLTYARINADGSLGAWVTSPNAVPGDGRRWGGAAVAYDDRLYIYSGVGDSGSYGNTIYASIQPSGAVVGATTSTAYSTSPGGGYAFTNNGYIYYAGGSVSGTPQTAVRYATINADGTYGSWTATSSLSSASYYGGYGLHNGRVYVFGGFSSDVVQYASFNSNGTLGAWTTTTALPAACGNHSGTVYNGYLYYVCGAGGNGSTSQISYAPINSNGTVGTWTQTASGTFTQSVAFETMYIYAGYMYIIGGSNAGVRYDLVRYAKINNNGTLGTFSTTTSTQQVVAYAMIAVVNGYMYRVGGEDDLTKYATIEYAKVNSDGTLGSWSYTNSLPQTVSRSSLTNHGDKLYTISGNVGGSASTTSYVMTVGSGGSGAVSAWGSTTNLTSSRYNNAFATYNGRMYTSGGYQTSNGTYLNTVQYATINNNGTLGSWTATTSFTTGREAHAMLENNGYLYVAGGSYDFPRVYLSDIQYAPINSDGTVGAWQTTTSLPTAGLVKTNMTIYGGYMYVASISQSSSNQTVYYAPINSNGTLGSWTATTSLSSIIQGPTLNAYNGYLYAAGGFTTGFIVSNVVEFAPINSNGTIGSWSRTTSFNIPRTSHTSTVYNGYMFVLSGSDGGSTRYNDIQYAPINANGTLGNWTSVKSFTSPRSSSYSVIHNGTLYLGGGFNGSTAFNDMQYATIPSVARISRYSALITLPTVGQVNSVYYNGSLSPASSITYRVAGPNGVLGATQSGLVGSGTPQDICSGVGDKYVWVTLIIDESRWVQYGGGYTPNNVTDITVNYGLSIRPSPEQRLFGGKSFQQETLQAHDTCGL